MSAVLETKADVIDEVQAIQSLLEEYHGKILQLPRSVTAARQLAVIISRLQGWHRSFSLSQQQTMGPSREEMLENLRPVMEDMMKEFIDRRFVA